MNRQEPPTFSLKGLLIWLALGLLGIGLAFSIALVARNLADQPVGLADEPVSAGKALDPPGGPASSGNPGGANTGQGSTDRKKEQANKPGHLSGGGSATATAHGSLSDTDGSHDSHDSHDDHHHDEHDSDDD